MSSSFKDMGLSEPILKALDEMGFEEPTEVQKRAIPHILNGKDVIVMSKTGSGKTAVFGVSILQMTDPKDNGPQCLILEPTRELAVQVDNDLKKMAKHLQHHTAAVYGQHNMNTEIQALRDNISIVTGTPGRIYDHIQHKNLVTKHIRFLVLDDDLRLFFPYRPQFPPAVLQHGVRIKGRQITVPVGPGKRSPLGKITADFRLPDPGAGFFGRLRHIVDDGLL